MKRNELLEYLQTLLEVPKFKDYCPNGLQVEGRETVSKVVCGVTASQALIEVAIERGADTILVHHGYFWKGESPTVIGIRRRRLAALLAHDLNLLGYHLPLDSHPQLGNNAQWAKAMGWQPEGRFSEQNIGWLGSPAAPLSGAALQGHLSDELGRPVMHIGAPDQMIRRLAWCSGGAQSYFEDALDLGVDAFVSGEISEQTVHLARESGVAYFAAGHHATERYGVRALAAHLGATFGLDCEFVDIDNPV